MRSFNRGRTAATLCLTACLLASQVMAAPGAPPAARSRLLGEVTYSGHVLVNGEEAASGTTVFPGSRFTTAKASEAVVNLGEAGRVRLAPETASMINFAEQRLEGTLDAGLITVSKPAGVSAVFSTKDGQVIPEKDSAAVFTLDVRRGNTVVRTESGRVELRAGKTTKVVGQGQSGSAGTQTRQSQDNDEPDKDGWFWLGVIGFTGEVVGAIIWAATRDENRNIPDRTPIIVSPLQ